MLRNNPVKISKSINCKKRLTRYGIGESDCLFSGNRELFPQP